MSMEQCTTDSVSEKIGRLLLIYNWMSEWNASAFDIIWSLYDTILAYLSTL